MAGQAGSGLAGFMVEQIYFAMGACDAIAMDETDIYFVTETDASPAVGNLHRVAKTSTGGVVPTGALLASDVGVNAFLEVTPTAVIVSSDADNNSDGVGGQLLSIAKEDGQVVELGTARTASAIAVDDEFVYWLSTGFDTLTDPSLSKISLADGTAESVAGADSVDNALNVAVDDTYVYWAGENVGVRRRVKTLSSEEEVLLPAIAYSIDRKALVPAAGAVFWGTDELFARARFTGIVDFLASTGEARFLTAFGEDVYFRGTRSEFDDVRGMYVSVDLGFQRYQESTGRVALLGVAESEQTLLDFVVDDPETFYALRGACSVVRVRRP